MLFVSREEKREAVSEFLPSVTISGYISDQENTGGSTSNFKPSEQSVTVEQKIFQGGYGIANFAKKKHGQALGEFKLKKIEVHLWTHGLYGNEGKIKFFLKRFAASCDFITGTTASLVLSFLIILFISFFLKNVFSVFYVFYLVVQFLIWCFF